MTWVTPREAGGCQADGRGRHTRRGVCTRAQESSPAEDTGGRERKVRKEEDWAQAQRAGNIQPQGLRGSGRCWQEMTY